MHRWAIGFLLIIGISCFLVGCKDEDGGCVYPNESGPVDITIIYTTDEHGWMEPAGDYAGAAGMMAMWDQSITNPAHTLILSGGDNWTGPAISTWFNGRSMIQVMNAMNYNATTFGNHEFDCTPDTMIARVQQADFTFLAANLKSVTTDTIPSFAQAYKIWDIEGVKVGVMGLANAETASMENVTEFTFGPYNEALNTYTPLMMAEGVDIPLLITHVPFEEIQADSALISELGYHFVGCGHSHEHHDAVFGNTIYAQPLKFMEEYAEVSIIWDMGTSDVTLKNITFFTNTTSDSDSTICAIVDYWQAQTDSALGKEIGYLQDSLSWNSPALANMFFDSWLIVEEDADIALSNVGSIRTGINAGPITLEEIVAMAPYDNTLTMLTVTGDSLIAFIERNDMYLGGMSAVGGYHLLNGNAIVDSLEYKVVTTDYLYTSDMSQMDPNGYNTGMAWREPLISWIQSLNTTEDSPLDQHLDYTARTDTTYLVLPKLFEHHQR